MPILWDGSVVSSSLSVSSIGRNGGSMGTNSNLFLRLGEVKEIIYPDDDRSNSKQFIEYKVATQEYSGSSIGTTVEYFNCQPMNAFGGLADSLTYTFRSDTKTTSNDGLGVGSKVFLLCLNGQSRQAFIIGGQRNNEDANDVKDDGHNLSFEFNGVSFSINKDGEATLQFKGATDIKGDPLEDNVAEAQPTIIKINKDGDFSVTTKDEGQFVRIEHKDKKIRIKGDAKVIVECQAIHLGEEDPSDNLALASKCMNELNKLKDTVDALVSKFNSHTHKVVGIKTAGTPVAHTQTLPVDSMTPGSPAKAPSSVDEVKSEVVLAK